MTDYKSMFEQAVRTLAAIDEALARTVMMDQTGTA